MSIQCQNLRDLKVLNWLAADFFGNVLMLKNGTGTEKMLELFEGLWDSYLPLNSKLFAPLFT